MPKRLLSLDPGGTTGAALVSFDESQLELESAWQIPDGLTGFLSWQKTFDTRIDLIVCESFTLRPGVHGANIEPTYIIGALTALYQGTELVMQEPKLKPLCDDKRLKEMGLYRKALPHGNDAIRHAIIYLRNKKHLPTLRKGWS